MGGHVDAFHSDGTGPYCNLHSQSYSVLFNVFAHCTLPLSVCLIQMKQFRDEVTPTESDADNRKRADVTNVALEETGDDDESQQENSKLIRMEDVHVAEEYDNVDRQLSIDSEREVLGYVQ